MPRPLRTASAALPAAALLAAASLLLAACSSGNDISDDVSGGTDAGVTATTTPPSSPAPSAPPSGSSASAVATTAPSVGADAEPGEAQVVARDLDAPWGLAFLPDGSALVSQRDEGTVVRVVAGGGTAADSEIVGEVEGVRPQGEGGLLGLAVSPDFATDRLLYAYYTSERDNRVVRMTYDEQDGLGPQDVVLDAIPKASTHDGGRIAFGPDGMLYVATGDASREEASQDRSSLGGKILRVTPDGAVPDGNPFPDSPVWSLGHRNVQGLAWDGDGRLWASEFGQNTWDELNLIEAGANYGWPVVEGQAGEGDYVDPVAQWETDEASPSGIAVAGDAVWLAALRGARLWKVPVAGGAAGEPADFLSGDYGRLRTVTTAPDGSLWVLTSNTDGRGDPADEDDRLLRFELA